MKVFADFHHSSLYRSFQILFEERLGWELYRPIGIDWFDLGYWKIADPYPDKRSTALQFLDTRGGGYERGKNLNGDYQLGEDEVFSIHDPDHNTWYNAVTFDKFKQMQFDIVIASYIDHIASFHKLISDTSSQAKLVHQMGNNWFDRLDKNLTKNLLASTKRMAVPPNMNACFYHQEIDPKLFKYEKGYTPKTIMSFVNVLHGTDLATFQTIEKEMPDYKFLSFGAGNREGSLSVVEHANKLKESQFVFHLKEGGDGFGHVIHTAFACGKPPIVKMSQYKGQLAEELMKDGETCINIDGLSPSDAAKKILSFSDSETYQKMSEAAYNRFCTVVDYDKEEVQIRKFLDNLK